MRSNQLVNHTKKLSSRRLIGLHKEKKKRRLIDQGKGLREEQ